MTIGLLRALVQLRLIPRHKLQLDTRLSVLSRIGISKFIFSAIGIDLGSSLYPAFGRLAVKFQEEVPMAWFKAYES